MNANGDVVLTQDDAKKNKEQPPDWCGAQSVWKCWTARPCNGEGNNNVDLPVCDADQSDQQCLAEKSVQCRKICEALDNCVAYTIFDHEENSSRSGVCRLFGQCTDGGDYAEDETRTAMKKCAINGSC